jgi:hypothetical protein
LPAGGRVLRSRCTIHRRRFRRPPFFAPAGHLMVYFGPRAYCPASGESPLVSARRDAVSELRVTRPEHSPFPPAENWADRLVQTRTILRNFAEGGGTAGGRRPEHTRAVGTRGERTDRKVLAGGIEFRDRCYRADRAAKDGVGIELR